MKPITLQLLQNGQLLGEWALAPGELELRLRDPQTGQEIAVMTAKGVPGVWDELNRESLYESEVEHELTMPLEEIDLPDPTNVSDVEAELWTRSDRGWQKKGALRMGQKATYGQAVVRLKRTGELVVSPGPRLSGGAELPTGGDIDIPEGSPAHRFPPGTSVILTSPSGRGFFVKSCLGDLGFRPIVERTREADISLSTYVPPHSDWGLVNED